MKRQLILLFICLGLFIASTKAQSVEKESLTVLNIDAQGVELDAVQMGNLVRIELDKLDTFEVMDKYDVAYLVEKNALKIDNCYGKICLLEVGKLIQSDKMFTGSVERYGKTIIMTLRLIDVASQTIEKTQVKEFLNLQNEMQRMIEISIRALFGLEIDDSILKLLTQKEALDNAVTLPDEPRLNLSGPRMGASIFMGDLAEIYQANESAGGFNANPFLFQFGYQFEIQYLNEGSMQGLFEIIPLVGGLEQGLFIPSMTVLHGLRNNKNGLEFAFGPTFSMATYAEGFYDGEGIWRLADVNTVPDGAEVLSRIDSRGEIGLATGFVLAAGVTFRSGRLNIPMNAYVIPRRNNFRIGISFGFNAKR
ncbi:MAG: hypothetical protein AAF849_21830 [Bacteroidota bacterium]